MSSWVVSLNTLSHEFTAENTSEKPFLGAAFIVYKPDKKTDMLLPQAILSCLIHTPCSFYLLFSLDLNETWLHQENKQICKAQYLP